jgi:hypothetical protein
MATKVYIEEGKKKVFAVSLQWSGWARSGKDAESALEALAEYAPRYEVIVTAAGLSLPKTAARFEIVETLPGNASTDFGMPAVFASSDPGKPGPKEAEKLTALLRAAWTAFDERRASAPAELVKGPRGGGRDRDKMAAHVIEAEAAYARKLGIKHKPPALDDADAIEALRADVLASFAGEPGIPAIPDNGWPVRYAARRFTWHVLDHLWEMEDRSG